MEMPMTRAAVGITGQFTAELFWHQTVSDLIIRHIYLMAWMDILTLEILFVKQLHLNLTETAWVKIISRATSGTVLEDVIITKRQTPFIGSGWPDLVIESSGQNAGAGEIIVDADNYDAEDRGTSHMQTNVWFFMCEVKSNKHLSNLCERGIGEYHD